MKLLSHIITTAHRPTPTLARSIESWRAGGFNEALTVCADGVNPPLMPDTKVVNTEKMGGLKSWFWSLKYLHDNDPARFLMVVEDDVTWTKNCAAQLKEELGAISPNNNIGYISLYACRRVTRHIEKEVRYGHRCLPPGYYQAKLGWSTWGSQCLIVPIETAYWLLNDDTVRSFVRDYAKNKNRDAVVSKFVTDMNLTTMFRIPCLVNHDLGAGNSALGNKSTRPGLECDYFKEAM